MPPSHLLISALALFVAARAEAACRRTPFPVDVPSSQRAATVRVANADLDLGNGVGLRVHYLEGRLVPRTGGAPRIDDHSAVLAIDRAEVSFGGPDSAALINKYLLKGSNLKRIAVWTEDGYLMQRGWFYAFLPIWVKSTIRAENGLIHLHPVSFTGSRWVVIEERVRFDPQNGICIEGNEIYIDPPRMLHALLPVSGSVTEAFVRGDRVVERFGSPPSSVPGSFIEFQEPGRAPVRIDTAGQTLTLARVQQRWDERRAQ